MTAATTAPASAQRRLHGELLRDTVAWCVAGSEFYRERFPAPEEIRGVEDLQRLPVLFRQDVIDNHARLICDSSPPAAIQHTTGTTGPFLEILRGPAEQSFVWEFFAAQQATRPKPSPRPLHLNLTNSYHGALTPLPSPAYILSASVHDEAQASQARGILERSYELSDVEERVSVVMGTERMVKALTAYLHATGYDMAASPVRTIALYGGHVPAARKRLIGELWQAAVQDQYSLTEVFGGAVEAGIGGPWVFDPHVIPEVVHPRTLEPVTEGLGVLLLTGLYPFVQQMPLVRYFTGDLVQVEDGMPRYAGRLTRSVIDDSGDDVVPLLLSAPLYEALDALPDIAIVPRFPDLPGGVALELTGDLRYQVEHEPGRITIRLGLRYAPWMFAERVAELVARLTRRLFDTHPELGARCADGRIELRIEPLEAAAVPPYDSK